VGAAKGCQGALKSQHWKVLLEGVQGQVGAILGAGSSFCLLRLLSFLEQDL
jgi:hypothetical protein